MTDKASYGMQCTCRHCGQDIEFHGREYGWIDRGGNRKCAPYFSRKADNYVTPKTKHARVTDARPYAAK